MAKTSKDDGNPKVVQVDDEDREAAAVLVRRAKQKIPIFESAEEINLVPYLDVMVNLIIFMLVSIAFVLPIGIISIIPPSSAAGAAAGAQAQPDKPPLNLTLAITKDGFRFGGGDTVRPPINKKANGEYDFEALSEAAVKIKEEHPDERNVIIAADGDMKYDILVKTMDTMRAKADKVLFDNVQLSPGIQ